MPPSASTVKEEHFVDDEFLARRPQQEEQDAVRGAGLLQLPIKREDDANALEERRLQAEDEALAKHLSLQQATTVSKECFRWCTVLLLVVTAIGATVAVLCFVLRSNNEAQGNGLSPFLYDSDPFVGLSPEEVAKWGSSKRGGLQLTVVNALESNWQGVFRQVIQDWNNGTPDVLELSVKQAPMDPDCEPIAGQSKVCNGNYGATQWKGINIAVVQSGYIEASAARMNDYYLSTDRTTGTPAQRRYTLCHEIGHAFGVPHTDEDYYNQDLGNCMDYTENPDANQQPDQSNFDFLRQMYGTLPGSRTGRSGNGRALRIDKQNRRSIPEPVQAAAKKIVSDTIDSAQRRRKSERWLQSGQVETVELDGGWSLQIHRIVAYME